jgi:DNA-binding CsgD family transcriptional regulator
VTDDKSSIESSPPAIDPAYELVSLLYESLRQVSACDAFRQGLARQLDVCLHSIIYHSLADSTVASYGSAAEKKAFIPQPSLDLLELPNLDVGRGEQLFVQSLPAEPGSAIDNSHWCVLWKNECSLVQLFIETSGRVFDPTLFSRRHRAVLNYILPHVRAAYGIFRRQQSPTPRLNGIQAIHSMLPLPVVIVRNRDKSRLPNVQALRLMNEQQKIRAERAKLGSGRGAEGGPELPTKAEKSLTPVPLRWLGHAHAKLGHQVQLLAGKGAAAAANPVLLIKCFGLSAAEAELCVCAMAGKSPQSIADELGLSINTVKARLKSIYRRVGVSSVAQLASRLYFHPAFWAANYGRSTPARIRPFELKYDEIIEPRPGGS